MEEEVVCNEKGEGCINPEGGGDESRIEVVLRWDPNGREFVLIPYKVDKEGDVVFDLQAGDIVVTQDGTLSIYKVSVDDGVSIDFGEVVSSISELPIASSIRKALSTVLKKAGIHGIARSVADRIKAVLPSVRFGNSATIVVVKFQHAAEA